MTFQADVLLNTCVMTGITCAHHKCHILFLNKKTKPFLFGFTKLLKFSIIFVFISKLVTFQADVLLNTCVMTGITNTHHKCQL